MHYPQYPHYSFLSLLTTYLFNDLATLGFWRIGMDRFAKTSAIPPHG